MLYAVLIIPHLAAIAGLLLYALRSNPPDEREAQGGSFGSGGEPTRPLSPPPTPPGPSPQAPREIPPRHRIRDADHSTRPARRPRREHPVRHSDPAPEAEAGVQAQ